MATNALTATAAPSIPGDAMRRNRVRLTCFRTGTVLLLALLGVLWFQSWSRIHDRFIPIGAGGIEFCLAASSFAVSIMETGSSIVDYGKPFDGPDAASLLHYDARWADGGPFGKVANSCLGPPDLSSVTRLDLNRVGSFGGIFDWPSFFHFRVPIWFIAAGIIGGWIFLESLARRGKRAVLIQDKTGGSTSS